MGITPLTNTYHAMCN